MAEGADFEALARSIRDAPDGGAACVGAGLALPDGGNDPFVAAVRATCTSVIITDPRRSDNPIVFANDAFCRMTGYERNEILGRNCRFLQGPETDSDAVACIRAAVESAEPIELDVRNRRKGGEAFWNRLMIAPVRDTAGQLVYFVASQMDVTSERDRPASPEGRDAALVAELDAWSRTREEDQVRLRELLHASRLSVAGGMAAALAHELNQPLTAVASAVKTVRRVLASSPECPPAPAGVEEALDFAAEQALRAGRIVRRLREFLAKGGAEVRAQDLRKLIEEAGALALAGVRADDVAIVLRFHPALPLVLVDRIQIQQVLVDLTRNAVEAMAGEASCRRELVIAAVPAGPGAVEVCVSDTGPGLMPEVADRLFEAFVSTKPNGTGLGLSICRTIVEAHGGRLWAEPNPGGGAAFRFTLPATAS